MSEGSTARDTSGARAGISERPARIQELRDAAGGDEARGGAATAVDDHRPADALGSAAPAGAGAGGTGAPSSVAAPVAPEAPPRTGRAGIVFVVVAVLALLAVAGFVVLGRSSTAGPAPTTTAPAVTAPAIDPAIAREAADRRTDDLCSAAEVYSVDDMLQLGRNLAASPDAVLAAYETMLVNSPPELRTLLDEMGPLTRKAVAEVKAGRLTTETAVQAWLAASPPAELEAWVGPQQELAPKLVAACSSR